MKKDRGWITLYERQSRSLSITVTISFVTLLLFPTRPVSEGYVTSRVGTRVFDVRCQRRFISLDRPNFDVIYKIDRGIFLPRGISRLVGVLGGVHSVPTPTVCPRPVRDPGGDRYSDSRRTVGVLKENRDQGGQGQS